MPAPYVNPTLTELPANDGLVERARAILASQGHSVPASASESALGSVVGNPLGAAQSWREQARDVLNGLLRLLEQLPASVPLDHAMAGVPLMGTSPLTVGDATLPMLRPAVAEPGRIATTALGLVNDALEPAAVALRATSLVSPSGDEIPAALVTFDPSQPTLQPNAETPVRVAVRVPETARPGTYTGLVQAVGTRATRALLSLEVK
jgi:hypothetical protein